MTGCTQIADLLTKLTIHEGEEKTTRMIDDCIKELPHVHGVNYNNLKRLLCDFVQHIHQRDKKIQQLVQKLEK